MITIIWITRDKWWQVEAIRGKRSKATKGKKQED